MIPIQDNNIIKLKSKIFAIRIIKLYKYLTDEKHEYVMSKQILRSGTSIGANVTEAIYAQSKADFNNKINIALKESAETVYWLELLYETNFITMHQFENINQDATEILKILISILKSSKQNMNDKE